MNDSFHTCLMYEIKGFYILLKVNYNWQDGLSPVLADVVVSDRVRN
jgi:hypothetical protein